MREMRNFKIFAFSLILISDYSFHSAFTQTQEAMTQEPAEIGKIKSMEDIIGFMRKATRKKQDSVLVRSARAEIDSSVANPEGLRLEVPFNFDSADLTPTGIQQLNELGKVLNSDEFKGVTIVLAGHTDERGKENYNQGLSDRRAQSARAYLIGKFNIAAGRIKTKGFGEAYPVFKNAQDESRHALNRRVDLFVLNGETEESIVRYYEKRSTLLPEEREDRPGAEEKGMNVHLKWGVFHVDANDEYKLIDYEGSSVLKSDDEYRIFMHPMKESYVYIYQVDSQGKGIWLFPRSELPIKNPLTPNDYWFPSRSRSYRLDENVGTEIIYFVVSPEPATDLGMLAAKKEPISPLVVEEQIRTRGLGKLRVKPDKESASVQTRTILEGSDEKKAGPKTGIPKTETAEVLSESGHFYVLIKFLHQQ